MPNSDLISAFESIGYTDREAAFLYLVAVHSGYFLRRQYCRLVRRERGAIAHQLIRKARAMGHVRSVECGEDGEVYHLTARPIYEALGMDDSQNRRLKGDGQIKARLMILDYVLDHLDGVFLKGEQGKIEYFAETLGLDRELLPQSQVGGLHYFADGFPILIGSAESNDSGLRFTFFDEDLRTTKRFERHLSEYRHLFSALQRFVLIYVATDSRNFAKAQRMFENMYPQEDSTEPRLDLPFGVDHFLSYVRMRAAYESGAGWPNPQGTALLRQGDRVYRSEGHAQALREWKTGYLRDDEFRTRFVFDGPQASLTCVQLRYRYPLFSFKNRRTIQPAQEDARSSDRSGQLCLFDDSTHA